MTAADCRNWTDHYLRLLIYFNVNVGFAAIFLGCAFWNFWYTFVAWS